MDNQQHRTIAGALLMVQGVLLLLAAVLGGLGMVGGGLLSGDPDAKAVLAGVGTVLGVILFILAVVYLAGGYGFMKDRPWARPLAWVLAILGLLSFPIGTAIGIYIIYVLLKKS